MKAKSVIAIMMAALMAAGLAGCGNGGGNTSSKSSQSTSGTSGSSEVKTENTDSEAASDLKMVSYFPTAHTYYDEVQQGVEAFAADTGIDVSIQLGADWEQSTQTQNIEALVAQGYNAISLYPADASGANGMIDEISGKGVNVVGYGADVSKPTEQAFCVATDAKEAAYQATKAVIEMMGEKGNIINVLEILEDSNTAKRKEGVEAAVAEYPDVKIIQEVSGIGSTEEAVTKMTDTLAANAGNVQGIICTGANPSIALVSVLSDYYAANPDAEHIYSIGIDTDPTLIKGIQDGVVDATIAQNPYGHGYISCMLLKYLNEGYTPKDDSEETYFIDAGYVVVNKDNIDSYAGDLEEVTQGILDSLTTDYLKK